MFSKRFQQNATPNALSLLLEAKKYRGDTIFDLTESNPTRVGLSYDFDEIRSALSSPAMLTYAPDPRGLDAARSAIAGYYRDVGETIDRDSVFLTASTSEGYTFLFKLLADPGDEILVPAPGYPLLAYLAEFENLTAVSYPLRCDDAGSWHIDLDVLQALITPKTRAIVVVSPNNPTGSYVKPHELTVLDDICRGRDVSVIVDEVFFDYPTTEAPPRIASAVNRLESLTFVLNGFSKIMGLPQMKLAWIVATGDPERVRAARSHLEMLLDFYLSVSAPVQHAAQRLLAGRRNIQQQIRERTAANRRLLDAALAGSGVCRRLPIEGGWYAVIDSYPAAFDETRILQLLEQDHTLVHPGYFYDFRHEGFVVVSLLPPENIFKAGIGRLLSRVSV